MIQGREGVALGILTVAAFLGCLAIVQISSEPRPYNDQGEYAQRAAGNHELAATRESGRHRRPPADQSICRYAETEKEYELCQSWRAADGAKEAAGMAFWQLIVSIGGLVGLIWTVIYTARAATSAAKAASETARAADTAALAHLPYLDYRMALHLPDGEQIPSGATPAEMALEITFENEGGMAAIINGVRVATCVSAALSAEVFEMKNCRAWVPKACWEARELKTFPPRALMVRGKGRSIIPPDGYRVTLTEPERAQIRSGAASLWVYGLLLFDNQIQAEHKPVGNKPPYPFVFARKYVFGQGFTHIGVPDSYLSR